MSDFSGEMSNVHGILFADEGYLKGRCNRAIFIADRGMAVRFIWIAEGPSYEPDYDKVLRTVTDITGQKLDP
jgi:peroxiredoxin